jgi:hypothetical protein
LLKKSDSSRNILTETIIKLSSTRSIAVDERVLSPPNLIDVSVRR